MARIASGSNASGPGSRSPGRRCLLSPLVALAAGLLTFGASPATSAPVQPPPALPASAAAPLAAIAQASLPRLKSPESLAPAPERKLRRRPGFPLASLRSGSSVALRAAPGGGVIGRLGDRTEFQSRRVLSVVEMRGRWLGVTTEERPNGRLGWIDGRSPGLRTDRTPLSLHADLSKRTLELRREDELLKRFSVAVGREGSSTPTGRFAVTDKLDGAAYSGYFGCCILPISGTQPNLPAGWPGGDRLAIHGTSSPETIGQAASAGCLRADEESMQALMRRVPVGTPVFIRP